MCVLNGNMTDIYDIMLIDKSMSEIGLGRGTNRYGGFTQTNKGHFNSNELGEYLLFVKSNSSPTLLIERSNAKNIYISYKDGERTKALYNELISRR
jgi:hypothetical protein